jgi:hypothetical protein
MTKKFTSVWPAPVYVATFADGATIRLSFATKLGKPLDYERGRNLCCSIRAREMRPAWRDLPAGCSAESLAAAGYFESDEYRQLLRHHAQRLVDAAVSEICGTPMPIVIKRYEARCRDGSIMRDGQDNVVWHTFRCGYDSVPLFKKPLARSQPIPADIIAGYVEKTDEILHDPFFAPDVDDGSNVVGIAQRRRVKSNLEKTLALLTKLTAAERAQILQQLAA